MKTTKNPKHVAIIMDGNRRWAKKHGLPIVAGHRQGYLTLKKVSQYCLDRGIKFLTVWAFSTDNWNRPRVEVDYIIKLLAEVIRTEVDTFMEKKVRLNMIGHLDGFPKKLQEGIHQAMERTRKNSKAVLTVALNYGGREEIIDAISRIVSKKKLPPVVTRELISDNLYTADLPDPDLIIRTSGEQRLSGFLPWQSVYAELFFTEVLWPDFSETDFDAALREYQERQRRFGK